MGTIIGTLQKDRGSIKFFNQEVDHTSADMKEYIGIVFDEMNFSHHLHVHHLNGVCKKVYKSWDESVFHEYMKRFSLPTDVNIGDFSRGMSMKLSLAVALSHDAKPLLLDEATAGLDPVAREDIVDVLREFVHDQKRSILMSSHITRDLETLADRLMFIKAGRLLLQGDREELVNPFGIVTCPEQTFSSIDPGIIICTRNIGDISKVLVSNRKMIKNLQVTSPDSLDHVSVLLMKGEPYDRTRIK